jgi:hypothetical protein
MDVPPIDAERLLPKVIVAAEASFEFLVRDSDAVAKDVPSI